MRVLVSTLPAATAAGALGVEQRTFGGVQRIGRNAPAQAGVWGGIRQRSTVEHRGGGHRQRAVDVARHLLGGAGEVAVSLAVAVMVSVSRISMSVIALAVVVQDIGRRVSPSGMDATAARARRSP
jgi:hypothetical protein